MMTRRGGEPRTFRYIKHIAGEALKDPDSVSRRQVQELTGSVLAHIEPRAIGGRRKSPRGSGSRSMGKRR
jgi:hypothetical protein